MSWDHEAPFILRFTVEAEHIDALEHTNNTQYVTWCNETAWAHTTDLGPVSYTHLRAHET